MGLERTSEGWYVPSTGFEVMKYGVKAVDLIPDDPENTLFAALTARELHLIVFALYFPIRLFPELAGELSALVAKLQELTGAQDFNTWRAPGGGNDINSPGGGE